MSMGVWSPAVIEALDVGQVKVLAIVILVGLVLLGLLAGVLVQKVALKLGVLVVIAALIGLVWWQRTAVISCAKTRVCSFFGVDVRALQ
jgi:protein-S-isoprenylcysteine O-methyltransferase Ste14